MTKLPAGKEAPAARAFHSDTAEATSSSNPATDRPFNDQTKQDQSTLEDTHPLTPTDPWSAPALMRHHGNPQC
jgi:hypothetical protein